MRYCKYCKREVKGTKKFNWIIFILGLLLFGVPGLIYLLWYMIKRSTKCPICGGKTKGWVWKLRHKGEVNGI